jgi:multidrug efflux pump subunit AcrB
MDGVKDAENELLFKHQLAARFAHNCTKLTDATMSHQATTAHGVLGVIGVSAQLLAVLPPMFLPDTESDSLFVPPAPLTTPLLETEKTPVLLCHLMLVLPLVPRCRLMPALAFLSALKIAS